MTSAKDREREREREREKFLVGVVPSRACVSRFWGGSDGKGGEGGGCHMSKLAPFWCLIVDGGVLWSGSSPGIIWTDLRDSPSPDT